MAKATAPRAKQIAIKRGKKSLFMPEGTATLGAAKDCLFRVEGAGVNDHHVNLEFNGSVVTVSANQEAEGIKINGKPLEKPQQLKTGDIIAFGTHSFEIGAVSNAPGAFRRALGRWYIRFPLYVAGTVLSLLLIVFIIAWIYLSPARISGWITEAVEQQLHTKATIGSLDYTFTGRVEINDFKIMNKPEYGDGPIVQVGKLETKISVWDILFSNINLNFTCTDPKVALARKMIAGRPSWNFEPLVPPAPPAPPPPGPVQPPPPRGQPIDLGIRVSHLSLTIKNLVLTVDDEFMKRKTVATTDLTAATDGVGKPIALVLTCPVDSNGRTGRVMLQAEANLFNKDGKLDLFTAEPPRLKVTPGDMVSSLPLQAVVDHLTAPPPTPAGEKERVYADTDLPIEPNIMGSAVEFAARLPVAGKLDAAGQPEMAIVKVPVGRLGDLGISWSNLTVASVDPLAVEIAGAVDIGEVGRHRAARLPGQPSGEWVDGDRLHLEIKKLVLNQTAKTFALDTELTVANAKQGQTVRTRLTAGVANLDLDALQAGDPKVFNAALRQIKFDNSQVQIELNLTALAGSGLGQLALGDRPEAGAALKSGNVGATVTGDGNLADGFHVQAGAELKDLTVAIAPDKSISKSGVNLVADTLISFSPEFLPSQAKAKRVQIDVVLGDNHYTITNLQDLTLAGIDKVIADKNPAALVATAEKRKVFGLEKDLVESVNPLLQSLFGVQLYDTLQIEGGGDLKDSKGTCFLTVILSPLDPVGRKLSPAAAAPMVFSLGLQMQQTADGKKQVGVQVNGTQDVEFLHMGLASPAVKDWQELATAPMNFTPEQAPGMDLRLAVVRERFTPYLTLVPGLTAQLNAIDFAANPRLVLTTEELAVNQPVAGAAGVLETRWRFTLGIKGVKDSPVDGKTILPKPTDFDLAFRLQPAYSFVAGSGGRQLQTLRLDDCTCDMNNEYVTLKSALKVSDILAALGPDPTVPVPPPTADNPHPALAQTLTRLPDRVKLHAELKASPEAYALAAALVKDRAVLRPLTSRQEALTLTCDADWDRADPAAHDRFVYDLRTQVDPFHSADTSGAAEGFGELHTHFESAGLFGKLPLPLKPDFDPVAFAFANQAQLDFTAPVSVDQIVLFAHDNAVTLQLDRNDLINMLNTPVSPLAAGGMVRVAVHVKFDGAQQARATFNLDLNDLYLLAKNEGEMHFLEVVKAKAGVPLLRHEPRAKDPQAEQLQVAVAATAEYKDGGLTLRLDDKENTVTLGPLSANFGATVAAKLSGGALDLRSADISKEVIVDLGHVAGLVPLTTDLNLSGRLHLKGSAQGLDLKKLLAPPALRPDGTPGLPPLFDPNINTATYTLYSAPELTVQPKSAPNTKLQLDFQNFAGDLGGNKTGEITLTVTAEHPNAIRLSNLRAVAKPEAGSFVAALESLQLRTSLKVGNDQPVYLTEMTGAVAPCLKSLGLPEPPPAPATPPPAGQPLQPGALDFIQPVTANLELDLKNLHYDRYEVDAVKGGAVLDQGELQMPEPPTATIYGGAATIDLRVLLIGATPNIPKIRVDIKDLDYNDFFTRAMQSPGAVAGKLQVHVEGTGNSALNPDIDSLNLTVIATKSEDTEITNIAKTPFFGALWTSAAQLFPQLPADPGPIKFGSQTLKNGKLENGYFTFSEFPFDPVDGPLLGYKVIGEGKIKAMTAHADYVTFKITAVPDKVRDELIATVRKDLLGEVNKLIPDKKYYLTDAELDDAAKEMQTEFEKFLTDGKLFVRGRGPLSHPTPEVTPPKAITDLLLKVGLNVAKKKVEAIAKKIAEEKLKEGLGNLLGPKKNK